MRGKPVLPHRRMDRGDLFWLVYLVFFFIEALERGSLRFWMECIGLVAVFVALYVAFLRATSISVRLVLLGAMFLLGVGTYPFTAGAISFFIYAAALLPFVVPSAPTVLVCLVCESLLMAGEGNGLRGMRERVESMGGRLSLEREHGTRLLIELPPAMGNASGAQRNRRPARFAC